MKMTPKMKRNSKMNITPKMKIPLKMMVNPQKKTISPKKMTLEMMMITKNEDDPKKDDNIKKCG